MADQSWTCDRIKGGLSSGDGFIEAVRDFVELPLRSLVLRDAAPKQRRPRTFHSWSAGHGRAAERPNGSGLKQRQREEKVLATVASLVGALVLARAVNDPKLSDDILRATKNRFSG